MSAEPGSERSMTVGLFLAALYRSAPADSLVEMRFVVPMGMGQRFHDATAVDRLAETILALAARTDVYVGVVPRRRQRGARGDLL